MLIRVNFPMNDPFNILIDIEQRCKKNARPLPWQKELGHLWQGIGFLNGDRHFVAPLIEVNEVLPVPAITPFPSSVPWFMGVANLRGHLLPVTNLEGFMFDTMHPMTALSRVLVVDFEQTKVGFLVQQVLGVERFLKSSLLSNGELSKEQKEATVQPYIIGEFKNEEQWTVISLKELSQTTQFHHVIKEAGVKTS
jgi:twitching motility protein PilI